MLSRLVRGWQTKSVIVLTFLLILTPFVGLAIPVLASSVQDSNNIASLYPSQPSPDINVWQSVSTPGSVDGKNDILNPNGTGGSDIHDLAVGQNGIVQFAVVNVGSGINNRLYNTNNRGISWTETAWNSLTQTPGWVNGNQVYQVAAAPDNSSIFEVTTDNGTPLSGPGDVWVTTDGGSTWQCAYLSSFLGPNETIRTTDVSVDYGGARDLAVGTTTGSGGGRLWVGKWSSTVSWVNQHLPPSQPPTSSSIDYFVVKFSPSYASDASLAVVFADNVTGAYTCTIALGATWYNVALRDIDQNAVLSWAFPKPGIEVKDLSWFVGASPSFSTLNKADMQLPSDFSGQAASLRRAYISLDAFGALNKATCSRDGIFRIDDASVYILMDTGSIPDKAIHSIDYVGTCASGKLLAGERMGYPCAATVPTWYTDSPTECPIPCWYPSLKPPTGAANPNQVPCIVGVKNDIGAAIVAWNTSGTLGVVITGSQAVTTGASWYVPWLVPPVPNDESAYAITRNNAETWNQLSLIDTTIDWFNDVAPSPDGNTVYLASANRNDGRHCDELDSVWRSSSFPDVVSPLPPQPVGTCWERVFTHVTGVNCAETQSDAPLLRLVPYCSDRFGEIVVWAAQNTRAEAWSPDFGEYWAMITPRNPIQDFCLESDWDRNNLVLYNLSPDGLVQKLPYTGVAFSTILPDVDSHVSAAHSITAYSEGNVIVGAGAAYHATGYAVSFSDNMSIMNTDNLTVKGTFTLLTAAGKTPYQGDVHVAFHPNFKDNDTIFIADENPNTGVGSVYRNNLAAPIIWGNGDMMSQTNGAQGVYHSGNSPSGTAGHFGIAMTCNGLALFSAHSPVGLNSGVCNTVGFIDDVPWPGFTWSCLIDFSPPDTSGVKFTLEPSSLKLTDEWYATNLNLYAIDNESGGRFLTAQGYRPADQQGMLWVCTLQPPSPPFPPPEANTYTNKDYCFSMQYPDDWVERPELVTTPLHLAAFGVNYFIPGVIIAALNADAPISQDWIIESFNDMGYRSPRVLSPLTPTTLPDGTKTTTYKIGYIAPTGYEVTAFCLDADRCDKLIRVMVFTIDAFVPYDETLFSDIAHTLTFTCTCGQPEPGPGPLPPSPPQASPALPRQLNQAQISLQYLSVNPQQAAANQPLTITGNVVNTGDQAGNYNLALKINGKVEQTRMVSVSPQATQPVKFTVAKPEPGTYTVDIGGQTVSFTILGASHNSSSTSRSGLLAILIIGIMLLATITALLISRRTG
jgi:hypothetical protein